MKFEVEATDYDNTSIEELIVSGAAQILASRLESRMVDEMRKAIKDRIEARAAREVDAVIERVLADGVQLTNLYGQPSGPPATIRDLFLKSVTNKRLVSRVETTVDNFIRKEMGDELKKLRAEVKDKLTDKMNATVLTEVKKVVRGLDP